jgi:ribosome recycling factor
VTHVWTWSRRFMPAAMFDHLSVDAYGKLVPLSEVAQVCVWVCVCVSVCVCVCVCV